MNWTGKRVLLTGHTGFKGSWLALWLQELGADLCGLALEPPTARNLFEDARVGQGMRSVIGDIRDVELIRRVFVEHQPEVVFHLAAQPLVRASYSDPVGTYATNVMGTAHVLDAARTVDSLRAVVVITTDKCYENREWLWPYRESDRLGGFDPYSNSKACAELVVSAYRNSFFNPHDYARHGVAIASARAGNVIGGGDWAEDRLIPDAMRAFQQGQTVSIRNPQAIRPWQHVLEPLRGYLDVATMLLEKGVAGGEAWNFGPGPGDARPVEWVVNELARLWGADAGWEQEPGQHPHEAQTLKLDISKAAAQLGWQPRLQLAEALAITVDWYRERWQRECAGGGIDMRAFTEAQIRGYQMLVDQQPTSQPNGAGN
ncbi:MAG: CDP-glucose 4,6-dehydratase [Terracidiphilus sp.]|nr:CDP-glucose 4,6-dehydratase [Terracidiphilus sp.]